MWTFLLKRLIDHAQSIHAQVFFSVDGQSLPIHNGVQSPTIKVLIIYRFIYSKLPEMAIKNYEGPSKIQLGLT